VIHEPAHPELVEGLSSAVQEKGQGFDKLSLGGFLAEASR